MSNPRIYIASKNVAGGVAFGEEHLYLIYDPDMDGDNNPKTYDENNPAAATMIVRGGPQSGISSGNVSIQIKPEKNSLDAFGSDIPDDRHLRVLFEGAEATAKWTNLESFAQTLGVYNETSDLYIVPNVEYELTGPNSNSTANSLMNFLGFDLRDWTPYQDGGVGYKDPALFPGQMDLLDGREDNNYTIYKFDSAIYSTTNFYKYDGTDTLTMEKGAELEIRNVEETDGLTRIVLKDVKYAEVGISESGGDLTVTDKSNWNPFSDDIVRLPEYAAYKGYNNTEFVFQDGVYRIGTNFDDTFILNKALGGVIDGRGGDDQVIYKSGGFYDQQKNVMWNEDGTAHDTLKNIESVQAEHAILVVDPTSSHNFTANSFAGYDFRQFTSTATIEIGATTIYNLGSISSSLSHNLSMSATIAGLEQNGILSSDSLSFAPSEFETNFLTLDAQTRIDFWGSTSGNIVTIGLGPLTTFGYYGLDFHGGVGDDTITIADAAASVVRSGLDIYYTGGTDTVSGDGAGSINTLYLDNGILIDDVGVSLAGDILTLTVAGVAGNILTVNGFNHETRIMLTSGGEIDVDEFGTVTKIGSNPTSLTLYGTVGDEVWSGRDDIAETYYGHGGKDVLDGKGGDDILIGGGGNDRLIGGVGDDTLLGGEGNDVYVFAAGGGHDHIQDNSGEDILLVKGDLDPEGFIYARVGDDLRIEIASGVIIDGYYGEGSSVRYIGTEDGTRYDLSQLAQNAFVVAGDATYGTSKDDVLVGGEFDYNLILAGDGNDLIYAGLVSNDLYGGKGNDTYVISAAAENNIHDTEGSNHLTVDGISYNDLTWYVDGTTLNLQDLFGNTFASVDDMDHLSSITFLQDQATISTADLYSYAFTPYFVTEGDDTLNLMGAFSGLSIDLLGGNDEVYGSSWGDIIHGGEGNDRLDGGTGNDTFYGDAGNDALLGNDGNDYLSGGEGDDYIYGGAGDDTLDGGSGYNHLYGDEGNDTYLISQGSGAVIDDFQGMNRIIVTDIASSDFHTNLSGTGFYTDSFSTFLDVNYMDHISGIEFMQDQVVWIPYMYVPGQYAFFEVNNQDNYLDARSLDVPVTADLMDGNDRFYGTAYDDTVIGGFGNDVLDGYAGNDTFYGGYGVDSIGGGAGEDRIFGGADNDSLRGEDGNDLLVGEEGDDFLSGDQGDDVYLFNPKDGSDTIAETDGVDTLKIGGGLTSDDLVLEQSGNHLIVHIGIDSSIKIINQYTTFFQFFVEWIEFDDGSRVKLPNGLDVVENMVPVPQNDTFTLDEDTVLTGNVLLNDSDPDGDTLLVQAATITTAAGAAVALLENGDFTYTPVANFNGADSFTYTVTDGHDHEVTATVDLTIAPVNDGPVAQADNFSGDEDTVISGNVLWNDSDVDGDTLRVTSTTFTTALGGLVTLQENGDFTYAPAANFNGADNFTYTVTDGQGGSAVSTVALLVNPVNDNPVAKDDHFEVFTAILNGNLLADNGYGVDSDVDGDPLSVTPQTNLHTASGGIVSIAADGTFSYQAATGYSGEDHFSYTLLDGQGGGANGYVSLNVIATPTNIITGTNGADLLYAKPTDTVMYGLDGTDLMFGRRGNDTIYGGGGNDTILSDGGNDKVYGGNGRDAIFAGDGNDLIVGGAGDDIIFGGSGADIFRFDSIGDGKDTIMDFNTREGDVIDISALLEGYDPVTEAIADFVKVTHTFLKTTISVDTNGGGDHYTEVASLVGGKNVDLDTMIDKGNLVV